MYIQNFLLSLPEIIIVVFTIVEVYLYFFPLKKLYKEVCVKQENKKSTIFFDTSQLKCLNRVKDKYPEYTKKIEKYYKINKLVELILWISLGVIFLFWVFGWIKYMPEEQETGYFTEKVTIEIKEGNLTTIKTYDSMKDFLK